MAWRSEANSIVWVTMLPFQREETARSVAKEARAAVDAARTRGATVEADVWQVQLTALDAQLMAGAVELDTVNAALDVQDAAESYNPPASWWDKTKEAAANAVDDVKARVNKAEDNAEDTATSIKWLAWGTLAVVGVIGVGYLLSSVAKVKGAAA